MSRSETKRMMQSHGFTYAPGFPENCKGCGKRFPDEIAFDRMGEFQHLDWKGLITMSEEKIRKTFPTRSHFERNDTYLCSCGTFTTTVSNDHWMHFYRKLR